MRVVWAPAALRDIEEIYHYIARFNPGAAAMMIDKIISIADCLEKFPYRGRAVPGTPLREMTLPYPYVVRYRIASDHVRVLRIRHGARRA